MKNPHTRGTHGATKQTDGLLIDILMILGM